VLPSSRLQEITGPACMEATHFLTLQSDAARCGHGQQGFFTDEVTYCRSLRVVQISSVASVALGLSAFFIALILSGHSIRAQVSDKGHLRHRRQRCEITIV
jgi:hypothetical protein